MVSPFPKSRDMLDGIDRGAERTYDGEGEQYGTEFV